MFVFISVHTYKACLVITNYKLVMLFHYIFIYGYIFYTFSFAMLVCDCIVRKYGIHLHALYICVFCILCFILYSICMKLYSFYMYAIVVYTFLL